MPRSRSSSARRRLPTLSWVARRTASLLSPARASRSASRPGQAAAGSARCRARPVSLTGAGTCTVEAEQAGNSDFERAPRVQQSFTVVAAPAVLSHQSISFTTTPPAAAVVGGPIYSVAAVASSGLGVSFAAASSSAGICTVSGSVVAFVGEGTCTVVAHQLGDDLHLAAPTVQQAIPVTARPRPSALSLRLPSAPPRARPPTPSRPTATSGLPVLDRGRPVERVGLRDLRRHGHGDRCRYVHDRGEPARRSDRSRLRRRCSSPSRWAAPLRRSAARRSTSRPLRRRRPRSAVPTTPSPQPRARASA